MLSESTTNISSKKPLTILLTGQKFSGKGSVAEYLFKKYKMNVFFFAEPLKNACIEFYGESDYFYESHLKEVKHPKSKHTSRAIMLALGDVVRDLDPTLQADNLVETVQAFRKENPDADVVVEDCRLDVEADAVYAAFNNVRLIEVLDENGLAEATHNTEAGLSKRFERDYILTNDKTDYVFQELDFIIKELRA